MTEVYLDYNGSSPLDRRVAEVMVPVLTATSATPRRSIGSVAGRQPLSTTPANR